MVATTISCLGAVTRRRERRISAQRLVALRPEGQLALRAVACQIRVRSRRRTQTNAAAKQMRESLVLCLLTPHDPHGPPADRICKLGVAGSEVLGPPYAIVEDSTEDSTQSQGSHVSPAAHRVVEPNSVTAHFKMGGAGLEPAATCV